MLAVGLEGGVLAVVLEVHGELVDAEVAQLVQPAQVLVDGPRMQKRSTISSGTKAAWVLPAWPCWL